MAIMMLLAGCNGTPGEAQDRQESEAKAWLDSARTYISRQDLRRAMVALKQAEKTIGDNSSPETSYQVYRYIAWVNESSGASLAALPYEQRALACAEAMGNANHVADALLAKANTLFNLQMNDSAFYYNQRAARMSKHLNEGRQSVVLRQQGYYEMLNNQLKEAEQHARKALELADDASASANAQALLCQVLILQGRHKEAEQLTALEQKDSQSAPLHNRLALRSELLERQGDYRQALAALRELKELDDSLTAELSRLDIVRLQSDYDRAVIQSEKARQQLAISIAVIVLLCLVFALAIWYYQHQQTLYKHYRDRLASVREDIEHHIADKDSTIESMKKQLDKKVEDLENMQRKLPQQLRTDHTFDSIATTKRGIDVLYSIVKEENISQMGKREQQAVTSVMQAIDPDLYELLADKDLALTPKETFFCIMERNHMNEQQKAIAFCSTEQAVRSVKSRLGKKIDLSRLNSPKQQAFTTPLQA